MMTIDIWVWKDIRSIFLSIRSIFLPTPAKKNWQKWVATLTHAYNGTISSVTKFSPYFLMFGCTPRIPLDIEMGVTLMEQGDTSRQNYDKKLKARLEWAYQVCSWE